MTESKITLHGQEYPVAFNLQTIINFEDITGHSIFGDDLTTMKSRIAMIMAAVLSADDKTALTINDILGNKDWQATTEIIAAYAIVDSMSSDFFKIPEIEKNADEAEAPEGEDQPKN